MGQTGLSQFGALTLKPPPTPVIASTISRSTILAILAAVIGSALVAVSIYLCYGFSDRLAAVIGESGMSIILRLSSFLLVCIGVQIFWNGARALLESLPAGH